MGTMAGLADVLESFKRQVVSDMTDDALEIMRIDHRLDVAESPVSPSPGKKVSRSPGRFRAAHRVSLNEPSTDVEPEIPFHAVPGDDYYDAQTAGFKLGDTIYKASNLPYSARIAEGWSPQAEADWMGENLEEAVRTVAAKRAGSA